MGAINSKQAMTELGIKDPDTLYALCKSGRLPHNRIGRVYVFDLDAVVAFRRGEVRTFSSASVPSSSVPSWPQVFRLEKLPSSLGRKQRATAHR